MSQPQVGHKIWVGIRQLAVFLAVLCGPSLLYAQTAQFVKIAPLYFTAVLGTNPLPQTFTITSTVDSLYSAVTTSPSGSTSWLKVTGCGGYTPVVCTVSANTSTIASGNYMGQVVFTAGSVSTTVPVNLSVVDPGASALAPLPGGLSFASGNGSVASPQTLQITNAGTGSVSWTATTSTSNTIGTVNWLSVSSSGGTTPGALTVSVSPPGLAAGIYSGQVLVQAANGSLSIPVTLTVASTSVVAYQEIPPLSFTATLGADSPLPQILAITSIATVYSTVTATPSGSGSWLSVAGGGGYTPEVSTVSVNTSTLAAGFYTGEIVYSSGNAALIVPVTLTVVNPGDSFLGALPGGLSFVSGVGFNAPPQAVQITNGGAGTLNWTATTSISNTVGSTNWLSLSSATGATPAMLTVSVSAQGLTSGKYLGEVVIQAAGGSFTIPVSLVVANTSNVTYQEIPALSFTATLGAENPLPQTLTLSSTGSELYTTVSWSPGGKGSWLTVSGGGGYAPTISTVSVNASSLAPGVYTGQVVYSTGVTAMLVPVTLTVVSPGMPFLGRLPGGLSFVAGTGFNAPAQTIPITNGAAGPLSWTATASTSNSVASGKWLSISSSSGTTPSALTVSVSPLGLVPGTYLGQVVVQAANGSSTIPVTLVVANTNNITYLEIPPLNFTTAVGAYNPLPQTITVTSTGATLYTTMSATPSGTGSWLTVTGSGGYSPNIYTVSVNASGLAAGSYTGQVVFSTGTTAMTVPVTLTVVSAGAPFLGPLPGGLSFVSGGGSTAAPQSIPITSGGTGTLNWTTTVNTTNTLGGNNWLSVSAPNGIAPALLTVSVAPQGLVPGTYLGEVVVQSNSSNFTIPVTLVVANTSYVTYQQIQPLTFTSTLGGSSPLPQTLTLTSTGASIYSTVTFSAGGGSNSWLKVTGGGGYTPGVSTVTVTSTALSAGIYSGQIVFNTGDTALTVPVFLTVTDPRATSILSVFPGSLTFNGTAGQSSPSAQSIAVSAGLATISYTVTTSGGSWLSATPSGTTPGSISVSTNTTGLAVGTYNGSITITASAGASNSPLTIPVTLVLASSTPVPTLTSITPNSGVSGSSVNVTLAGTGFAPGAMVNVSNPGVRVSNIVVASATQLTATFAIVAGTSAGAVNVTVTTTGGTSATLPFTINLPATSVILRSSANPSVSGQTVTLSASVAPSSATGTIIFVDGSATLGTAVLSGGSATLNLSTLSVGTHLLMAVYGGDTNYLGSTSDALTQVIVAASTSGTLVATPTTLSFTYQQGTPALPAQALTVSSTNGTQLPFSVASGDMTLLSPGVNAGTSPEPFNVFASPTLAPGTYTGMLTVSSPGVPSIMVSANLTVTPSTTADPPQLGVSAVSVDLSGFQGGAPSSTQIQVSNSGGGVLNFSASTSGGNWLSVSPGFGVVDNTVSGSSAPIALTIAGDPSSLNPGTYQGTVNITGAGNTVSIPVTFSVALPQPVILVSQAGLGFTAAQQGSAPLPQQLGILNTGNGTLNWNASVSTLSGGNWLQLSSSNGTVQQPFLDVSLVGATIDPAVVAGLAPGDYYGQVRIADTAGLAVNSPQLVTVILTVLPQGTDPGPEVNPSSLIFTGSAGTSPSPRNVMIGIRKGAPDKYLSGQIGSGFSFSPPTSDVLPNQPVNLQVNPDFTALSPGAVSRGTIALQFLDGTSRNISLLTVVAPSAASSARLGERAGNSCTNPVLNVQWRTPSSSPSPNFAVVQGRAQTLDVQVVDNCGNLVGANDPKSASLRATFSNKDPDLTLVHVGNGVWTGTWKPVNSSPGPVTVVVTAFNSAQVLQSGQSSSLFGTILPGNTPLVTAGGVQHAASYVLGAPIAPGTLVTLKGLNLADADSLAPGLPLPTTWNGTQVFLGTEALPLLYTASGQVNVQVPYDVPVNTQFQVTVQRDNVQSLPEQLVIAAAQPGIFTVDSSGAGQGIIYHSDGVTLAQPGSPATAGEMISILCTGLGTVTPAVAAGTPPPASPVSSTDNAVSVSIGGQDGLATVGTLVPGQPGVYQVNAVVPMGVSGDALPVVVSVAGQTSPAVVTMSVQ